MSLFVVFSFSRDVNVGVSSRLQLGAFLAIEIFAGKKNMLFGVKMFGLVLLCWGINVQWLSFLSIAEAIILPPSFIQSTCHLKHARSLALAYPVVMQGGHRCVYKKLGEKLSCVYANAFCGLCYKDNSHSIFDGRSPLALSKPLLFS